MEPTDITLPAKDGYPIACSLYEPKPVGAATQAVIISGATAVKRGYYGKFAEFLCGHGLTVLTFDYRGIGGSLYGDIKTFRAGMRDWAENDLAGVLDAVSRRFPSSKPLMVGHSAGGQFLGLCANNNLVSALLAVASQSGYWQFWAAPRRYLLAALWYGFMPAVTYAMSYFPAKTLRLGENLPAGVALEWARWCRNRDFITDSHGKPLREHFEKFNGAIFAYSFDDDSMAPKAAVESLVSFYSRAQVRLCHVRARDVGAQRIGHFGFFNERFKDSLWNDGLRWLLEQSRAVILQRHSSVAGPEH